MPLPVVAPAGLGCMHHLAILVLAEGPILLLQARTLKRRARASTPCRVCSFGRSRS